jgi:hypothetical protein
MRFRFIKKAGRHFDVEDQHKIIQGMIFFIGLSLSSDFQGSALSTKTSRAKVTAVMHRSSSHLTVAISSKISSVNVVKSLFIVPFIYLS